MVVSAILRTFVQHYVNFYNSRQIHLEYFAFAEAVLTDGKAEIRVYRENEADGKGIRFEEFRKTMKKDNSGRGIALFLAERFNASPEQAELLNFEDEDEVDLPF